MWIVPSEFSKALEGLSRLAGGDGGEVPSWLNQTGASDNAGPDLDTSSWFESSIPPAAAQPEAINLRPSDDDPETRAAHEGMAEDYGSGMPSVPPLSKAIEDVQTAPPAPQPPEPPPT
jgi:hypothetical protein